MPARRRRVSGTSWHVLLSVCLFGAGGQAPLTVGPPRALTSVVGRGDAPGLPRISRAAKHGRGPASTCFAARSVRIEEAHAMTRRRTEQAIAVMSSLTAVNAAGGAWYGLSGAPNVPAEWLAGSLFRSYRTPSLILGVAVGGSTTASAVAAWRGSDAAGRAAVGAGGVLVAWIAAQVAIIGLRSPLQPAMGAVGASLIGLGWRLRVLRDPRRQPRRRR